MYKRTATFKKVAIITEYLAGSLSYRQLGNKYGINHKTIHHWVMQHEGKKLIKSSKKKLESITEESISIDIKELQEQLRKAKLENKLLNAIIDIAEEQLNIEIRKKSGTKQ
jgi:transposase-like protein